MLHALFTCLWVRKLIVWLCSCVCNNVWGWAANVLAPVQRRSLLGGYPGHDALPRFYKIFKKFQQLCRDRSHERKVFDGSSILRKVKMVACVGWGAAVRSKFLVFTPPRVRHEDLRTLPEFSGLRPPLFKRIRVTAWTLVQETIWKAKPRQVTSLTFWVLGGCEQVVALSGLRRLSVPTPTPQWLQSKTRSSQFSKIDYALPQLSWGARKWSGYNATWVKYLATRFVALRLVRVITWNKFWYNYFEGSGASESSDASCV
jgi:hypothetical protein